MKQVHSFRVSYTSNRETQHNDMVWEVDCQRDIIHHQMHLLDTGTDPQTDINEEEFIIGGVEGGEFIRQPDGTWTKQNYADATAKATCRSLQQGADIYVMPHIATMIKRGILQKGDKKMVNGVRCRQWRVTLKGGMSGLEHDMICIGLENHLPYEMTTDWEGSHTSISDYNLPLQFDLPEGVVQPTAAAN